MNLDSRLRRVEAKMRDRQQVEWFETPEGRRELAITVANMHLSMCGGHLGDERVESAFPDNPCPYEGAASEAVIALFDNPEGIADWGDRMQGLANSAKTGDAD